MKKFNLLVLLLAGGLFITPVQTFAQSGSLGVFVPPSSQGGSNGIFFEVGGIFMRPSDEITYAFDNPSGANDPGGTAQNVQSDYGTGVRVTLGWNDPTSPWAYGVTYSYLTADGDDSVTDTGGEIRQTLSHANNNLGDPDEQAQSDIEFDYHVVDLVASYGVRFGQTKSLDVTFFGGVRIASIEQHLNTRYTNSLASPADQLEVISNLDYFGAGPRIGIAASREIGWGLSVFGKVGYSLLVGTMEQTLTENELGSSPTSYVNINRELDTHTTQVLDILAGIRYVRQMAAYRINAVIGWQFERWTDLVNHQPFHDDVLDASLNQEFNALALNGPIVQLGVQF